MVVSLVAVAVLSVVVAAVVLVVLARLGWLLGVVVVVAVVVSDSVQLCDGGGECASRSGQRMRDRLFTWLSGSGATMMV